MAYTIYERRSIRVWQPAVTITAVGRISLNAPLTRTFRAKAVEAALLLSDLEQQMMALRPTGKKDKRSYIISYGAGQAFLSARSFLKAMGWDERTYRIPAEWNEKESHLEFKIPVWGKKGV
jgi:hypothetical protein